MGHDRLGGRDTDGPSLYEEILMESLRQAEEAGWHHCPRGTREGDHYDRLVEAMKQWNQRGA